MDVANRPTRTLSEPDGICSSGVGQHPATALAPPLGRITPNPLLYGVSSALSRRFADFSLIWLAVETASDTDSDSSASLALVRTHPRPCDIDRKSPRLNSSHLV